MSDLEFSAVSLEELVDPQSAALVVVWRWGSSSVTPMWKRVASRPNSAVRQYRSEPDRCWRVAACINSVRAASICACRTSNNATPAKALTTASPVHCEWMAVGLNPRIHFHAVAVTVIERDQARLYSVHLEGLDTKPGESIESVVARAQRARHIDRKPGPLRRPLEDTWISEFTHTRLPYVCTDLRTQRRFRDEEDLLEAGGRSYISLPLIKHDELIGAVTFISFEERDFTPDTVQLLQDLSEIVSSAVSNALRLAAEPS